MFWKRKTQETKVVIRELSDSIVGFCDKQRRFCLYRNGMVIEEFDKVEDEVDGWYIGYRGKHPYIVNTHNGNIYDVFQLLETDDVKATERIMDWILPGLRLFYRDTDEPIDVKRNFKEGNTLHAGSFIDVSPYAGKPIHKYRYIIASAHAAKFGTDGDRYPIHTLHINSYLKIMDVYEESGITQILLLHIPAKSVSSFSLNSALKINIFGKNLVEVAREDLNSKLLCPVCDKLEEEDWLNRTRTHIGCNSDGEPYSLLPFSPTNNNAIMFSKIIRRLGHDTDPINIIMEDSIPYNVPLNKFINMLTIDNLTKLFFSIFRKRF